MGGFLEAAFWWVGFYHKWLSLATWAYAWKPQVVQGNADVCGAAGEDLVLKMNAASLSSTNYYSDKCDISPYALNRAWTLLSSSRLPFDVTLNWLESLLWKAAAHIWLCVLWNYLLLRNRCDLMRESSFCQGLWTEEFFHSLLWSQSVIMI